MMNTLEMWPSCWSHKLQEHVVRGSAVYLPCPRAVVSPQRTCVDFVAVSTVAPVVSIHFLLAAGVRPNKPIKSVPSSLLLRLVLITRPKQFNPWHFYVTFMGPNFCNSALVLNYMFVSVPLGFRIIFEQPHQWNSALGFTSGLSCFFVKGHGNFVVSWAQVLTSEATTPIR